MRRYDAHVYAYARYWRAWLGAQPNYTQCSPDMHRLYAWLERLALRAKLGLNCR